MKFIIIIYTTNKLTVVEMEDIRGVRLRKFNLRKIVLGVRMHFHHSYSYRGSGRSITIVWYGKLEWRDYPMVKKIEDRLLYNRSQNYRRVTD